MARTSRTLISLTILTALLLSSIGCGPTYVSSQDEKRIDNYAMSTGLDRRDLYYLYDQIIDHLMRASIIKYWERRAAESNRPTVAIFPMRNETSEHIDNQLDALLSKFETDLVSKTTASVISLERQPELIAEIKQQQSSAYNPNRVAQYGQMLGAQYIVTGKVYDQAERVNNERRVQYFMFVQVINVTTSEIEFQHEAEITKGLVR